jgi:hypothetical protein
MNAIAARTTPIIGPVASAAAAPPLFVIEVVVGVVLLSELIDVDIGDNVVDEFSKRV